MPTTRTMTGGELRDTGVLHRINEEILWPLGLALTTTRETEIGLTVRDHGEEIVSGLDKPAHDARHAAFERFASRRAEILRAAPSGQPAGAQGTKKPPAPKGRGRAAPKGR